MVTKHIGNLLKTSEINEKSNVQKMHIASSDKPVAIYSLDVILAIGYRTSSIKAIHFRRWASEIIKKYIIEGYTIDRSRIAKNYNSFMQAVEQIKFLLPVSDNIHAEDALELIKLFADTWMSLDAYDKSELPSNGANKKQVKVTTGDLISALQEFKNELMKREEASDVFGYERASGSVSGIIGNIFQSFGGKDVYQTIEEKAAHLLYFMV